MPGGPAHDSVVSQYLSRASYRFKDQTKRDILGALHHYPGLKPRLEKYTFPDGRQRDLICLEGTIPVPYRGSMYNIPVGIWLLETHPDHAPMCYVRPTADMQIKVSQHVDNNGKIYHPYLHDWNRSSDILSLIQMCIITFREQPPVFVRSPAQRLPAQQVQQAYPQPYPPQNAAFGGFSGYPAQAGAGGYPASSIEVEDLKKSVAQMQNDIGENELKGIDCYARPQRFESNGRTFVLTGKIKDKIFYRWVYILGSPDKAKHFSYTLKFFGKDNSTTFEGKVATFDESFDALMKAGKCFTTTHQAFIHQFVDEDRKYECSLQIKNLKEEVKDSNSLRFLNALKRVWNEDSIE